MSLPVLDKESYQFASSDYVLQAGQALKDAGYLQSEPTGTYDEEFAAAVTAFQTDKSISEENQVGPYTWEALGITDTESGEDYSSSETSEQIYYEVGQLSEDGQWEWNGTEWVAAGSGQSTETPEYETQESQEKVLSEDGQWEWNGTEWVAAAGAEQSVQGHQDTEHAEHHRTMVAADPGREVLVGDTRYIIYPDEVRFGGTVSWRARNPGNIRAGEKYGAYPGKKANTKSVGSFAIFPDEETGYEGIKKVLKGYSKLTVFKTMDKYAPEKDGNDPLKYAQAVAKDMGVSIETTVGSLDDSQIETFAQAIKRIEGWKEGTAVALHYEGLPEEVKKAIRGE